MTETKLGPEDPTDALLRQIENKVDLAGKDGINQDGVPMSKLLSTASKGEKCKMYLGWLFAAITGSILPTFFYFLGPVFDSFGESTTPEEARDKIREICIIMGCLALGIFITSTLQNYLLMSTSAKIAAKLKTLYLKAVLNQESAWYDQSNYLSMSARIGKEVDQIQAGIGTKFGVILYSICMCISGFVVGFTKGWSLALAMLAIAPIMFIGMGIFGSVMQKRTKASMEAYGQSAGYAEQALSAIRIVVSFGQEALEINNYSRFLGRVQEAGIKSGGAAGASLGFFFFCIYICYGYCFAIAAVWVDKEYWNHTEDRVYLAGDCISVFFGVLIGLFSLGGAGPSINAFNLAKAAGKQAYDVIDRKPLIDQDDKSAAKHDLRGEIEFRNVSFYYPSRPDQAVMKEFSMTFQVGQTTAIVGPSGSGKSTTVQLVERFYDPTSGDVFVDGKNLKTINLRDYRQQIGYVGQEPVLFNTTIKQNILMGKPDATDDEIIDALKKTNAWDFVQKYPDGINSNVGVGGGQLSGGQKQRIALARAFIKKPHVLIFDEATSALDKVNEAEVQKAIDHMKRELGQVTTIVIAHRLSTVRASDRIVVMKKGKIVEDGNHDSLLANYPNGIYAKLNQDQKKQEDQEKKDADASADMPDMADLTNQIHPALLAATKDAKKKDDKRPSVMAPKALAAQEIKEKDPVAKKKLEEAEAKRIEYEQGVADSLDYITNPKKAEKTFKSKLGAYAKPGYLVVIGVLCVIVVGVVTPMFGWFLMECMNNMNESIFDPNKDVFEEVMPWVIIMVIATFVITITKSISGIVLSRVSENITTNIRKDLYESVVRKDIGWHDDRENSAGVMTATLASDVQLLNGVSSEGFAVQMEASTALLFSIAFAFYWSWPMALCSIGITPFIMICGTIAQKADNENMMNMEERQGTEDVKDDQKESQILCSDSISNYKTVASFGNDQILIGEFKDINLKKAHADDRGAKFYALSLGISVAVQNGVFAVLYLASAELFVAYPNNKFCQYDVMYIAMFVFIFGSFTAATSASMGPDVNKAKRAAIRIFSIIGRPSKIDVKAPETTNATPVNAEGFQGEIEFKDVWFRYPTRLQQWVFKGLNLKINRKDAIAIVGESGQGKSTFINLVMRFYDPEFGTVLIDGVDVKTLNVVQLRERLGLVMQEPLLFNYTILENILYGKLTASDEQVYNAAKIANALEFIESNDLSKAFDDSPSSLLKALRDPTHSGKAKETLGQEKYDATIKHLEEAEKKELEKGKFEEIADLVDSRSASQKGNTSLSPGFKIFAGNRGSKLSGGQKQRIAIARAVIRNPGILLLDEATSALDEESQRLVQEALYQIMQDRTSIVVAHRLTTVERCTRLAVIEDGKIVEEGTFQDLTSRDGGYFANLAAGMRKAEKKQHKRASLLATGK